MANKISILIASLGVLFTISTAQAICVKNDSDFQLYYEIYNRNGCPSPKVKFHSGLVQSHQEKCHAHSQQEGDDWRIYRNDFIKIFKINKDGAREEACTKTVTGILNTLEISYYSKWWCLDNEDYED